VDVENFAEALHALGGMNADAGFQMTVISPFV